MKAGFVFAAATLTFGVSERLPSPSVDWEDDDFAQIFADPQNNEVRDKDIIAEENNNLLDEAITEDRSNDDLDIVLGRL